MDYKRHPGQPIRPAPPGADANSQDDVKKTGAQGHAD